MADKEINIKFSTNVNKVNKDLEDAIKLEERYNATLETTGMTYQELSQLYSELIEERSRATTPIQIQVIDQQLTAIRKNIALMGREAQLSGAKMIGSQTSVMGVMQQVIAQWRNGTLTLKGLTAGIKLFAKSTLVLAAVQLAWEGISWVLEKVKGLFFQTAEAEAAAAKEAEDLAVAAKKAHDELLEMQHALSAERADEARLNAAKEYTEELKAQTEEYKEQLSLIEKNLAANLRLAASLAKEEEHKIALDRLALQDQKMAGEITDQEYQEQMIELEERAAEVRRNKKLEKKEFEKTAAIERLDKARAAKDEADMLVEEDMFGYELSDTDVKTKIAEYNTAKAEVDKYRDEYKSLKKDEADYIKTAEEMRAFLERNPNNEFARYELAEAENKLASIKNYEAWEDEKNRLYEEIPEIVREYGLNDIGLSQYKKERDFKTKYNKDIQKQREDAEKAEREAEAKLNKAEEELSVAAETYAQEATFAKEIKDKRIGNLKRKFHLEEQKEKFAKRLERMREEVDELEWDELKKRKKEAKAAADLLDENTPEGKQARAVSKLYSDEYKDRRQAARVQAARISNNISSSKEKENNFIQSAEKFAQSSILSGSVDLDRLSTFLEKAEKTKSKMDDLVAARLYETLSRLITITNNNTAQLKRQAELYNKLKKNTVNKDS